MQGYSPFVPPPPTPLPAASVWQSPMLHHCSNPFLPPAPAPPVNMQAAANALEGASLAPAAAPMASDPSAAPLDRSASALLLQAQLEAERSRASMLATQLELAQLEVGPLEGLCADHSVCQLCPVVGADTFAPGHNAVFHLISRQGKLVRILGEKGCL